LEKAFLTVEDVSAYLNVKPSTIYSWAKVVGIPHFKLGKMLRFKRSEIDAWMEAHRGNGINPEIKAKEILKGVRNPKMYINRTVKKVIEEAKNSGYTPNHGKSDQIRGLKRKEVGRHGSL